MKQFDFGQNWDDFSSNSLNDEKVKNAKKDFQKLLGANDLDGKTFIDIGFGQGLGLLSAKVMGADVVGCDINPKCGNVIEKNLKYFPDLKKEEISVIIGSILEPQTITRIHNKLSDLNSKKFDIVHSWGVLHHTGNMFEAIDNAASLVKDDGTFIIAIYNRHWSSKLWLIIKWMYNYSPKFIKWLIIYVFTLIIFVAKFLVTFKNPLKKDRGMNFYYDVIDWVGGYPYEYASRDEIQKYVESKGFTLDRFYKAKVPTGCNEYVFSKT